MKKILFCLAALGLPSFALAQTDPGALSLVDGSANMAAPSSPSKSTASSTSAQNIDDGLETNQYVKKPKAAHKKKRAPASEDSDDENSGSSSAGSDTTNAVPDLQNAQVAPLPRLGGGPASEPFNYAGVPQPMPGSASDDDSGFGSRMRDLFFGGAPDSMARYRSLLDSEDIRKNLLDLTLASTYLYNTSQSPYFYRNYINSAPGVYMGLDVWVTPFFAIDADYRTTLLDSVKDSATQDYYVYDSQSWFGLGFKFRRFFGMSANSAYFTLGLRYADFNFFVSSASQSRLRVDSNGPELTLDMSIPSGKYFDWTFGMSVDPYINQTETPVGPLIQSGSGNQTVGFGLNAGGESRISRKTRIYFKLSAMVYKSLYSGESQALDPVTNSLQLNVPVNNFFYMIDVGLHLGR